MLIRPIKRVGQSTRHATSSSERLRERIVRGTIVVPSPKNFENLKKFSVFSKIQSSRISSRMPIPLREIVFLN